MKIFITLLGLILWHQSFAFECDFGLRLNNVTAIPITTQQVIEQPFVIRREKNQDNRCSRYRLYFSKGQGNSYQRQSFNLFAHPYNYNLHQNINTAGILKEFNDALNPSEYIQGNTPNRRTDYNGSFYLSLPGLSTQTNQKAGVYSDMVQIAVYRQEDDDSLHFEFSQNFQVNITIPVSLSISLVNEGDPFNQNATTKVLDFGILEVNQELSADIVASSNTPYSIRVSSLNNGAMVNHESRVGYSMKVNNIGVPLNSSKDIPVTIATSTEPSPVAGSRYNLKIRVTDLPETPSPGLYQDSITITAIAN